MVSTEGGDRSNLTSSDSGQTARLGGGSPIGDDSFAMPVAAGDAEIELPAIEDGEDSRIFADSYMIAENVMASRSPPREIMGRPGRSQQGAPPSRGTARSGASPAHTPSRMAAAANDAFLSPMTRQFSSRSRSDPFGGMASTSVEQASAQIDAYMQKDLCAGPSRLWTTCWARPGFTSSCACGFYVVAAGRRAAAVAASSVRAGEY